MFRIDIDEEDGKATMKIMGRLGVQCAEEVRRQVLRCKKAPRVVIDLSEVAFIDNNGEEVPLWLGRIGARFMAQGFYCLHICERFHLSILKGSGSRRRLREAVG